MTDLSISALVSRDLLSLGDLDINSSPYRLAGPQILGGEQRWERQTAASPFVDGEVTVHRRRANVTDQIVVYVSGTDTANMFSNIRDLIDAFTQDRFTLQINIGTATNQWDCECADYSVTVDTPHMVAKYGVVQFNVPRKPVPLTGGY
jgi:hypothetical protein